MLFLVIFGQKRLYSALRQWICPVCKTKVIKSHYSLLCGGCSNYFHPHCVNIQESVLRLNKSFKYVCKQCEGKGGSVIQRNRESNSADNLSNLNDGQSKGTDYQKDDSVSNGCGSDVITRMDCSKAVNDASGSNNGDNNGNNMPVTNSADAGRSSDGGGDAGGCGSVVKCDVTAGGSGINNSGVPMINLNDYFGNLSVYLKNQLKDQQKELNDQIAKCTVSFEAKID